MEIDINTLNTIFSLARLKQVELAPNDEQALITIINVKAQVLANLDELNKLKKSTVKAAK